MVMSGEGKKRQASNRNSVDQHSQAAVIEDT